MSTQSSMGTSGEGSRPTTDGGVDNLGGASAFTPGKATSPGSSSPMPTEKMAEKKSDKAAARGDDSAPLGLTEPVDDNNDNSDPPTHE